MAKINRLIIAALLALSFTAMAQEEDPAEVPETLDPEEEKILQEIRTQNIKEPEKKGITRINDKYRIKREDNRILVEYMNVGDVYEVKTCYGNPFRISLGDTVQDKIFEVKLGNIAKFDYALEEQNRNSVVVSQKTAAASSIHTTLWLVRNSDKRAYVFNITGEPCPSEGLYKYPVEIIIQETTVQADRKRVLLPTDFLTEITKNYPRKNESNDIFVNGLITVGNTNFSSMGVSIVLKNTGAKKKMVEPKFIALNWSKTSVIDLEQEFLTYSSQAETDLNKLPTLRFNLRLKIGKKSIIERKKIFLLVVYEDEKYYQIAEIPMEDLLKKLKETGWEI